MSKPKETGLLGMAMGAFMAAMLISVLLLLLKQSNSSRMDRAAIYHVESQLPDSKLSQSAWSSIMGGKVGQAVTLPGKADATASTEADIGRSRCSDASKVQICSHRGKGGPAGATLIQAIESLAREVGPAAAATATQVNNRVAHESPMLTLC
jgi:hypothetical protein